jgi:hypothetical protein
MSKGPLTRLLERDAWIGCPVLDSRGVRIGHVCDVTRDPLGGARFHVRCEWGLLDWLIGMGAGQAPTFELHSDDLVEERGALRLNIAAPSVVG